MPEEARPAASPVPRDKLSRHIAFIMDGNGRWARARGFERLFGHETGASSLRRITRHCRALGVREITFFALSTENYERRPRAELGFLMRLLRNYLVSERPELLDNDIRLKHLGWVDAFPADVRAELEETERLTAGGKSMVLRLALNYGSRQEIVQAAARLAGDALRGRWGAGDLESLGEEGFRQYLLDPEMSDPDLLIRTAGEFRLSNFLLWQCSYCEVWVTPELWPDFDVQHLEAALRSFAARERKYGALAVDPVGTGKP